MFSFFFKLIVSFAIPLSLTSPIYRTALLILAVLFNSIMLPFSAVHVASTLSRFAFVLAPQRRFKAATRAMCVYL